MKTISSLTVDVDNPKPVGVCDRTGFLVQHDELCKQMEWRGNRLVWTGMMVAKPYLDEPNPQNKIPKIKADPKPIKNPRPLTGVPELKEDANYNQIVQGLNDTSFTPPNNFPVAAKDPRDDLSYQELVKQLKNIKFNE